MVRYMALVSACLCGLMIGCTKESERTENLSTRKVKAVCTIGMITDIVQNVGADRVEAVGLMGPGVDPHLFRASEGDVARMSDADIIFFNGLHLEGAMTDVLERMQGRVKAVAVAESIDDSLLLSPPNFEGAHDPHVWFDVRLWIQAVREVSRALSTLDSTHRQVYEANAGDYIEKLEALHQYAQDMAATVPTENRVIITAHDAFNYFGRAYGFEVRGLQGISTAAEAGTADVQSLAKFIAERRIPAVFVESSVPPRHIEAVQAAVKARGFEVQIGGELFSDAMGTAGTPEGTYIGMVKHNVRTIVESLTRQKP